MSTRLRPEVEIARMRRQHGLIQLELEERSANEAIIAPLGRPRVGMPSLVLGVSSSLWHAVLGKERLFFLMIWRLRFCFGIKRLLRILDSI